MQKREIEETRSWRELAVAIKAEPELKLERPEAEADPEELERWDGLE